MQYEVNDIQYDTDGEVVDLPTSLKIDVPDDLDDVDKVDFISDKISEITGFCHTGFTTIPEISE